FIGSPGMNFVAVKIVEAEPGVAVEASGFRFILNAEQAALVKPGPATLGIRPQDVGEASTAEEGAVKFSAQLEVLEPLGSENYLYCKAGDDAIAARVGPHSQVKVGEAVELAFHPRRFHLFDVETTKALIHPVPVE
ncbi:MAG: TOBE domain-containing protein, partial [Candidatus Eremiobacteraeota bacterium]|nr:TOBE domain-containing protein [Candidatus Eremiobacteraeota bacterium]